VNKLLVKALNSNRNARIRKIIELDNSSTSEVTVVVPIFDQEDIIYKHLESLCENMVLPFELIIINDSSTDKSGEEISRFLTQYNWMDSTCVRVVYFENMWPWFETKCDDFAIRTAESDYILELQADMLIREKGFDEKLLQLLKSDPLNFALSARGVHKFRDLENEFLQPKRIMTIKKIPLFNPIYYKIQHILKKKSDSTHLSSKVQSKQVKSESPKSRKAEIFPDFQQLTDSGRAGFLGTHIECLPYEGSNETVEEVRAQSRKIWFGETIMRGPLILDREKYLKIGGFKIDQFFLGNDDHDLNLRIRDYGFKVGFTPIQFASPLVLGNSRKKSKLTSRMWRKVHRRARKRNLSESALYKYFRT